MHAAAALLRAPHFEMRLRIERSRPWPARAAAAPARAGAPPAGSTPRCPAQISPIRLLSFFLSFPLSFSCRPQFRVICLRSPCTHSAHPYMNERPLASRAYLSKASVPPSAAACCSISQPHTLRYAHTRTQVPCCRTLAPPSVKKLMKKTRTCVLHTHSLAPPHALHGAALLLLLLPPMTRTHTHTPRSPPCSSLHLSIITASLFGLSFRLCSPPVLPFFLFSVFGFQSAPLLVSMFSAFCPLARFHRWVAAADRRHAFFHTSVTHRATRAAAGSSIVQQARCTGCVPQNSSIPHPLVTNSHAMHCFSSAGTAAAAAACLSGALSSKLPTITGLLARRDQRALVRSSRFNTGRGGGFEVGGFHERQGEEALQRKGKTRSSAGCADGMRSDDTHTDEG